MTPIPFNSIEDRVEDIDRKLSELAEQINATWSFLTSRRLGEIPFIRERIEERPVRFADIDLDRLVRRLGMTFGRGGGLSSAESVLVSTLEASAGRAWQKFLTKALGTSLFTDFATGVGVSLIDSLFSAIGRAIKPKRLNLPLLPPEPIGSFPSFPTRRGILRERGFRSEQKKVSRIRAKRATDFSSVGDIVERLITQRLSGYGG